MRSFLVLFVHLLVSTAANTSESPNTQPPNKSTASARACPSWYVGKRATYYPKAIFSPNYPSNYSNNEDCWWSITSPSGGVVITVDWYDIENADNCAFDSLKILPSFNGIPGATLCGASHESIEYRIPSRVVNVTFHSDGSITRPGYRLTYQMFDLNPETTESPPSNSTNAEITTESPMISTPSTNICSNRSAEERATWYPQNIKSPNFPSPYPNNEDCQWSITSPSGGILVTVEWYDMENHADCTFDSLKILRSFNGIPEATLCGISYDRREFRIPSSVVYFKFHSDESTTGLGYSLTYQAYDPNQESTDSTTESPITSTPSANICSNRSAEESATWNPQTIRSSSYPNNEDCWWSVTSTSGGILIIVEWYYIENAVNCAFDSLKILTSYNGIAEATLCGTSYVRREYRIPSNVVFFKFHSDGSVTGRGYSLTYQAYDPNMRTTALPESPSSNTTNADNPTQSPITSTPSSNICSSRSAGERATWYPQIIISPNFPSDYPNNEDCWWSITSPSGGVLITLEWYDMERATNCLYDSLKILTSYNGIPEATLCGRSYVRREYRIPSNVVFFKFHSDGSVTGRGYSLTYQAYDPNMRTTALPESPSSNTTNADNPTQSPITSTPSSNICSSRSAGERATWYPQIIISPNFPSDYPNNEDCWWSITSPSGGVLITLEWYDMERATNCLYDSLKILTSYNGIPEATLCGRSYVRREYRIPSNVVFFKFHSDGSVTGRGYILTYQAYDPNMRTTALPESPSSNTTNADNPTQSPITSTPSSNICSSRSAGERATWYPQIINSPNFPSDYPNNEDCWWSITSASGGILVTVEWYNIESDPNCAYDSLKILPSYNGIPVATLCGVSNQTREFRIPSDVVYFKFKSDISITSRGYSLTYQAYDPNLGTTESPSSNTTNPDNPTESPITSIPSTNICSNRPVEKNATWYPQVIKSPNYPSFYRNNQECWWSIASPSGWVIITVEWYDIEHVYDCSYDSLKILKSLNEIPVATLCGASDVARQYRIPSSVVYIKFHSDGSVTRPGYNLTYQAYDHTQGTTESPSSNTTSASTTTESPIHSPSTEVCPIGHVGKNATWYPRSIKSPNYPSNYPVNVDCWWSITSPSGGVLITVQWYDIEDVRNCIYDSLVISPGDNENIPVATLCGSSQESREYRIPSSVVYIKFHSDRSVIGTGYSLTYQIYDPTTGTTESPHPHHASRAKCPNETVELVASSTENYIESPNYPSNYSNNEDCKWRVSSPFSLIKITVEDYNLESSDCVYDYLRIFDGESSRNETLATLCSKSNQSIEFTSSSNSVFIVFHTDGSVTRKGFRLSYQAL